jgi:uncharacterized protein YndB with AHSA1/START domain
LRIVANVVLGVPDELRREIVIRAERERVWAAVTDPALLVRWFPTVSAEIDLRPGGEMRFVWDGNVDEAVIEVVEPPSRFVFRWRPSGGARPYTTVTITLDEVGGGTRLVLTESGFSALPDQIHEQSFEGNLKGWTEELEELRMFMEGP